MKQHNVSRLFILGAGFSKPAGLPLGTELLQEIVNYVDDPSSEISEENSSIFQGSLEEYQNYSKQKITEINIEEFIEYIDYHSFLNFYGTLKSPSRQGNNIQKVIRVLITAVLLKKQEQILNSQLYEEFVDSLTDKDIIISLNYDTILEFFLNKKNKKFRLLPHSIYEQRLNFEPYTGVTLLKVHGSINWFDLDEYYEQLKTDNTNNPLLLFPADFIFNNQKLDRPQLHPVLPLNIKPTKETNLKHLYWISDLDLNKFIKIYNKPLDRIFNDEAPALTHPVILSPAYSKLLYSESIKDLFYGAGFYGRENDEIIIIGCSLTKYDQYIRQWVFDIVRQYYGMYRSKKISIIIKAPKHWKQKELIKKNYSYLDENKINFIFDGFSHESLAQSLYNVNNHFR